MNPTDPNKEYTVSLNLDDDDQLLVQNMDEYDDAEETAELLKLVSGFLLCEEEKETEKGLNIIFQMKGTKIMSVFQLFWNLILGISGGIISGIIVSRIFLIQGDFQNQINSFDLLLRKLGYTSGMLFGIRTVQEFSYDSDIKMHNENEKRRYIS